MEASTWSEDTSLFEGWYDTNTTYSKFKQMMNDFGYIKIYGSNADELFVLSNFKVTPYIEKLQWNKMCFCTNY